MTDRDLMNYCARRWSVAPSERCLMTRDTVDEPLAEYESGGIVAQKGVATYGTFRVDRAVVVLERASCLRLGLLLAATLLFERPVQVVLTDRASTIRRIVLRPGANFEERGLRELVAGVGFWPKAFSRCPWYPLPEYLLRTDLPHVALTDGTDDAPVTDADWARRDTLVGFGNAVGCAQMSLLLLNAAGASNDQSEFVLNHEPGPASVAPGSCELQLLLRGAG